jgi:hypothetical protein
MLGLGLDLYLGDISTYSDIIDQPQATSSPNPTINVNKKQKVAKKKAL